MEFFSALSLLAPKAELTLRGELDAFAALELRRRLDDAVDHGCLVFTVDASEVTFVDAGGFGMFVWLSNTVRHYGGEVTVLAASHRFKQVAVLAGLGEQFGVDLLPDAAMNRSAARRSSLGLPERSRLRVVNPRSAVPAGAAFRVSGLSERTTA
jgi:anti-anti-sigma factor